MPFSSPFSSSVAALDASVVAISNLLSEFFRTLLFTSTMANSSHSSAAVWSRLNLSAAVASWPSVNLK